MTQPNVSPQATAAIDEYVLTLARRSELPFALAEEARRELAAHIADLAQEGARAEKLAMVDLAHVRKAIEAMGSDAAVLAAFFQSPGTSGMTRVPWGRAFLLVLSLFAGFATIITLLINVESIDFQALLILLPTTAAAVFGSAAIWMLPARWSFGCAAIVFTLPLMLYAAGGHEDGLLFWIWPAVVIVVGGIVRTQIPAATRPVARLAFDLEPIVQKLGQNWRRAGRIAFIVATVLASALAFGVVFDEIQENSDADEMEVLINMVLLATGLTGGYTLTRSGNKVPFIIGCVLFVASFALNEFVYPLSFLMWAMPAILLAAGAVFTVVFPTRKVATEPTFTGTGSIRGS